jgi:hypothetical protein
MRRETVLRVVLIVVGLLFAAGGVYVLIPSVRDGWRINKEQLEPMFISLYVTQGICLLLAARKPSGNRGVISFAGWLNVAHAAIMTIMSLHLPNEREDLLVGAAVFGLIGAVLILLAPAKQSREDALAT